MYMYVKLLYYCYTYKLHNFSTNSDQLVDIATEQDNNLEDMGEIEAIDKDSCNEEGTK